MGRACKESEYMLTSSMQPGTPLTTWGTDYREDGSQDAHHLSYFRFDMGALSRQHQTPVHHKCPPDRRIRRSRVVLLVYT